MKAYLILLACTFVVAYATADVQPNSTSVSQPQAQQVKPTSPMPVLNMVDTEFKPAPVPSDQLTVEEPKNQPSPAALQTETGKLEASQDTPVNPQFIVANSTVAPSNSTSDASKTLGGMTLGTVALIVVCVLAVVVLSVGLLQYLLKSRRMSNRS